MWGPCQTGTDPTFMCTKGYSPGFSVPISAFFASSNSKDPETILAEVASASHVSTPSQNIRVPAIGPKVIFPSDSSHVPTSRLHPSVPCRVPPSSKTSCGLLAAVAPQVPTGFGLSATPDEQADKSKATPTAATIPIFFISSAYDLTSTNGTTHATHKAFHDGFHDPQRPEYSKCHASA